MSVTVKARRQYVNFRVRVSQDPVAEGTPCAIVEEGGCQHARVVRGMLGVDTVELDNFDSCNV